MSSILRALKKLEQDTATGRAAVPEIPVKSNSGQQRKIALAGFVAVVALMAAGVLFSIKGLMRPPVTGKVARLQKQAGPVGIASSPVVLYATRTVGSSGNERPTGQAVYPSVKSVGRDMSLEPEQTAGAFTRDADVTTQLSVQKMPTADLKNAEAVQLPDTQDLAQGSAGQAPGLAPVIENEHHLVESTRIGEKKSAKVEPEPDEIGDSAGLQLQAISWSPTSARRMAVINGRICHEGEWVEGYLVTGITTDYILLKKGGTIGKLSFKLR